ncbi:MAG: restriction endonuclease [Azospirillum sp.]|nr:restriction endonuclease [Azospirillum sp.]
MPTTPEDAHRLIHSVVAELGWSVDSSVVTDKVRRLDVGLPCEDEFSVVCGWLGKCRLLHKLDQQQIPISSREEFQVPDLLALFSSQSTSAPVLIEVKSKNEQTLSFKPDYHNKLMNYANILNLPLLIAWKCHSIWTLFEVKHLTKAVTNFNISHQTAMKENLLGVLVGDVAYTIGQGAGIYFRFCKEELLRQDDNEDGKSETWRMVVDEAAFTDYNGVRRTDLDSEVASLFIAWNLREQEEHTDTHVNVSFVAGPNEVQFAHKALVHLLNWELPHNEQLNWRRVLQNAQITKNITNFSAALDTAMRQNVVYHIFHQLPTSMPEFVSRS